MRISGYPAPVFTARAFDALLEAVCKGRVGLVLSIEASRLSRNGREWHTLLDFCAIVGLPGRRPGPALRPGTDR